MEAELEPDGAQGCSAQPWVGSLLSPQPVPAVPTARAYLGFVDGAVESVVLLVVEQTEIQRPQRGCKGGETRLTRQTRAALPRSAKGVRGDAKERAADIIKHKASCWEPCYQT